MKAFRKGKLIPILFAIALLFALPCAQCAYAAPLPADDDPVNTSTTLSNINVANTADDEQAIAFTTHGKSYIVLMVILAVLALGFIVVFNIQRAAR